MNYQKTSVSQYSELLSKREPVPGGGSAAALTAALGASLLSMVANYSIKKTNSQILNKEMRNLRSQSERIRKRLLKCIDLDAKAYLNIVNARGKTENIKKNAKKKAQDIPREVMTLCKEAIQLTPKLVKKGNFNLISDVQVAGELLLAAFQSSLINEEINQ
jgi:methenyltetrahydrofolate cyclohydrolase